MIRILIAILGICLSVNLQSQIYKIGTLPQLYITSQLYKDYLLTFKLESRQIINEGESPFSSISFKQERSDISAFIRKRVGFNSKLALGYMHRLQGKDLYHRWTQGLSLIYKKKYFNLGHRFLCDQTYSKAESAKYRFRYRYTLELPFKGQEINTKEIFIKLGNEYISVWQDEGDFEFRTLACIGYVLPSNTKLELGIDYRANQIFTDQIAHQGYLYFAFYLKP